MDDLAHQDRFCLQAAHGWVELGNPAEALHELDGLSATAREHPEVLGLRWHIAAKSRDWETALGIAGALVEAMPESPSGWIHRSYCLHELKRTREAWDSLLPLAKRFPKEWLICYNLACYACQLGLLAEARTWFTRAVEAGDPIEINRLAADDPDLRPLIDQRPD
jgi:predicted Zn-dependent protease